MRIPRHPIAAVLTGLLVAFLALAEKSAAGEVGKPLPDPKAFALEGSWPAMRGKVVLVDFWASWCGPCKKSFPALEALHQRYKGQGLVVIGVSVDEESAAMRRFLKQHEASFSTVRDQGQKFVKAMGIAAMPTSLLVDRGGTVRFINSGFKGAETGNAIRQQIEQLLKGSKMTSVPIRWPALFLLPAGVTSLSGCAAVAPWQRRKLAEYGMRSDRDPLGDALVGHVYFSREAAFGGRGIGGGGCGCN